VERPDRSAFSRLNLVRGKRGRDAAQRRGVTIGGDEELMGD